MRRPLRVRSTSTSVIVSHSGAIVGASPPVATTAHSAPKLDQRSAHQTVDHHRLAEHESGLHALARVRADDVVGGLQVDLRQPSGLGEQRLGARLDSRSDRAAQIGAVRRNHVHGGGGAEVDDDDGAAVRGIGRDAVHDAVGTDLVRVVVADRHTGLQAGAHHEDAARARIGRRRFPRRGEPRHHRSAG